MDFSVEDLEALKSKIIAEYLPSLATAILILVIGWWVIGMITRGFRKIFKARELDKNLESFLVTVINTGLKVMLAISVLQIAGLEVTAFVAVLGAAGLAIGMALSGTLQNFAGGVLLLILKPFKSGHFIEALGYSGTVQEVTIFNTILTTPDNKTIILPNGPLSTSSLTNYSAKPTRRVDMTFGIGYDDDIDKAKATLNELIEADERILKDPAHVVVVSALADSSVNFAVRVWVNAPDYWGVFFAMQEKVKKTFDERGISIPFPQRDIHVYNEK